MQNEFGKGIPFFYNLAKHCYRLLIKMNLINRYLQKLERKISMLYPRSRKQELLEQYMCYKLMLIFLGMFAGGFLLLVCMMQHKNEDMRNVCILFLICLPFLFFVQDENLEKRKQEKEEQMIRDYPIILNKLTLYISAGLTMRNAFQKIGNEYIKEKNKVCFRYGYEEILYLCRELQGGISERKCLEHFGERCGVACYRRFSMILLQNMKKGCDELTFLLRREAMQAFEIRKQRAKKRGEEAGTKLLLPMIFLMCIVFVLLIVPAWMSFQI